MPSVWPNASSGRPGSIPTEGHRLRPRATRPVRTCGCYWRTSDLKQEPEEVPHTEHELVLERVCDRCRQGLGQSVRAGEQPGGKRVSKVWGVPRPQQRGHRAGRRVRAILITGFDRTEAYGDTYCACCQQGCTQILAVHGDDPRIAPVQQRPFSQPVPRNSLLQCERRRREAARRRQASWRRQVRSPSER